MKLQYREVLPPESLIMKNLLITFITLFIATAYSNADVKTLKPIESIVLDESAFVIKKSIQFGDISPSGSVIALADMSSRCLLFFNSNTGELIKQFWASDSLSNYYVNAPDCMNDSITITDGYQLISNDSAESLGKNREFIANDFSGCKFLNDSTLLIGATLRAMQVSNKIKKKFLLSNIASALFIDTSMNVVKCFPFEANYEEYPLAKNVVMQNDKYVVTIQYLYEGKNPRYLFGLFNSDGKYSNNYIEVPKELIDFGAGSKFFVDPLSCFIDSTFFWTTRFDFRIRTNNPNYSIDIESIDTSNLSAWNEYAKQAPSRVNSTPAKRVFHPYNTIKNLFRVNDSIIGLHMKNKKDDYVQLYTTTGKLLKTYLLSLPTTNTIDCLFIDYNKRMILSISKDENDFSIQKYKMD